MTPPPPPSTEGFPKDISADISASLASEIPPGRSIASAGAGRFASTAASSAAGAPAADHARSPSSPPFAAADGRAHPSRHGREHPLSVYVHFPYCLTKCPYCDFVSYKAPRESIDHGGYADAVLAELEARAAALLETATTATTATAESTEGDRAPVPRAKVGSIFFGGGTPSLWEPSQLGRVLSSIRRTFECVGDVEVTVECNPTSLDQARAEALGAQGVNRLSIGAQSLRAEQLQYLGRLHSRDGAIHAIQGALRSGIGRVSADLIFGLPNQSADDARDQAMALADLGLDHLSCYQLTIEPGTQFGELARRGRLPLADDGLVADAFSAIDEALSARGFRHYEISNYGKPGQESRHNLGYWKGDDYLGLGCGAYGCVRPPGPAHPAGRIRYRNAIDPDEYRKRALKVSPQVVGEGDGLTLSSENLAPAALLCERIMLGLRLEGGFDLGEAGRDLGIDPWTPARCRTVDKLIARGRLLRAGSQLWIPKPAWIWADDTAAHLF